MRLFGCLVAAFTAASVSCVVYGESKNESNALADAGREPSTESDASTAADAGARSDAGNEADAGLPLSPEQRAVLDAANAYRAQLDPAPTPALPQLEWFHDAVPLLRDWSLGCEPTQNRKQVGSATRYTPVPGSVTPQQLIESLASGYNYANNSCSLPNGNCVVPKALIQRAVTRFACTWNSCMMDNQPYEFWACAFAPEFDVDARPY